MPIFEYDCLDCGARFSALVGVVSDDESDACPKCASKRTSKRVSRPGKFRTEDGRLDDAADRVEQMGEPETYSDIRRIMRETGDALDDSAADEMEEMLESDLEVSEEK
jgi:putative FmdB family regulatory protein